MKNEKIVLIVMMLILSGCSELLLISSGASVAISQSPAVKAYNGVDMITIMQTEKDIKKHVYEKLKGEKNGN
jgi:hypothetical protein|tara:strand:+ start:115 stop:330 length:216 start_codon:yes stop_codon:yes gene_type:complete